jgi:hypothetical protein
MSYVLMYLTLVGLPFLGLLGILELGKGVQPPPSLRGEWRIEANLQPLAPSPCAGQLAGADGATMTLAQSGAYVTIRFPDARGLSAAGTVDGATLTAGAATAGGAGPCVIGLRATVADGADTRQLSGELFSGTCPDCVVVPFHATRLPRPATPAGEGH